MLWNAGEGLEVLSVSQRFHKGNLVRVQGVNPLKNYGLFISRGQLNESSTPICFKIKFYEDSI